MWRMIVLICALALVLAGSANAKVYYFDVDSLAVRGASGADTNTYIVHCGNDSIAIITNGVVRTVFGSTGNFWIGSSTGLLTGIYSSGGDTIALVSANKKVAAAHYTASGSTLKFYLHVPTVGDDAEFEIKAPESSSAGTLGIRFSEGAGSGAANNMAYVVGYTPSSNLFRIYSRDTDGSATGANIIQIPDGQLTVDGNSTFDDNAFDYVCPICYRHTLEPGRCPKDGAVMVWNDDVEMLREAVREFGKSKAATMLERVGVIKRQADGQRFISMNRAPWVAFSAIVQQSDRITRENSDLQAQIDALKESHGMSTWWYLVLGVLMGGVVMARKKALFVIMLAILVSAGGVYALSMEGKILMAFYAGNYEAQSTQAIRAWILNQGLADSSLKAQEIQDSLRAMESESWLVQMNNKIKLTATGRTKADSVMVP